MDYSVLSGIYGTGVTLLQIIGEKWGGGIPESSLLRFGNKMCVNSSMVLYLPCLI